MNHKIWLITVTYNSKIFLKNLFKSIKDQSFPNFTWYIIDNNSPDDTLKYIKSLDSWIAIKIIENQQNTGFAKATNQWIKCAIKDGCNSLFLLTHDTVFTDVNLFQKSYDFLYSEESRWALVPTILYYKPNQQYIWWVWTKVRDLKTMISDKTVRLAYHISKDKKYTLSYKKNYQVDSLTWCALYIKSSVVDTVWLLDERFFMYGEDVDWSIRIKKYWYKIFHFW